jgi:hypothetical protein
VPQISNGELSLSIHFPKSWTDIGQDYLAADGLMSYTLCLKFKSDEVNNLEDPEDHLRVACDLLLHEAQRFETSGIYLLWKNTMAGLLNFEYGLTIYLLNPFSFLTSDTAASFVAQKNSPLLTYLKQHSNDFAGPGSLLTIAAKAREYLGHFFEVEWDRSSNWSMDINDEIFCSQRLPLNHNSWGAIGEFIRDSYLHPAVRKHYLLSEELSGNGYLQSFVSFQLLTQITGTHLFKKGEFHHADVFAFGMQVRRYAALCYNILNSPDLRDELAEADLFWQGLALLTSFKEAMVRIYDLKITIPPNAVFAISGTKETVPKDQVQRLEAFVEWFGEAFLGMNKTHRRLLRIGFAHALYFSIHRETLDENELNQAEKDLSSEVKNFIVSIVQSSNKNKRPLSDATKTILNDDFGLPASTYNAISVSVEQNDNNFYAKRFSEFLKMLRYEIGEVYHAVEAWHVPESMDWTWFIETAETRFREGKRFTVLELTSNGMVQLGQLNPEERYLGELKSAEHVFFKFNQAGIATILSTTWSDLKSGKLQYK